MAVIIPALGLATAVLSGIAVFTAANRFLDRDADPSSTIPDPIPFQPPFDAGFVGGQCQGDPTQGYWVAVTRYFNPNTEEEYVNPNPVPFGAACQIPTGLGIENISIVKRGFFQEIRIVTSDGVFRFYSLQFGNASGDIVISNFSTQLYLYDYQFDQIVTDGCGDLPNPNPVIPPSQDGGDIYFIGDDDDPQNGYDPNPLITAAAILAGLAAIAAAIKGVADSLEGIKKIGEALEKIAELLKKFADRNDEEDKEKPKNRGYAQGQWYELPVDGGFGIKKIIREGKEYSPYQVQFQFKGFPVSCSRRVGIKSVSFANQEPIGWVMPRSVSLGFYEPIPIRYINSIIPLPDDCDGFSFTFRENPSIDGKVRIIYSFPPELED